MLSQSTVTDRVAKIHVECPGSTRDRNDLRAKSKAFRSRKGRRKRSNSFQESSQQSNSSKAQNTVLNSTDRVFVNLGQLRI